MRSFVSSHPMGGLLDVFRYKRAIYLRALYVLKVWYSVMCIPELCIDILSVWCELGRCYAADGEGL